jgi:hypothetical protein
MPFYRFDFSFDAPGWSDLQASGTERLQAIDQALSNHGWTLYLFWPSEGAAKAYVLAEDDAPDDEMLAGLAGAVGGSLSSSEELSVDLPDRPTTHAEKFELLVVAAHRGPDGSCLCGAIQPPHEDGCPRKHHAEPAATTSRLAPMGG